MPAPTEAEAKKNTGNEQGVESGEKRKQVLDAFSSAFEMMRADDGLNETQKKDLAATTRIKEKTIDAGKTRYKNVFEDPQTGKEFSQYEGVPVEGLIEYLQAKAAAPGLDNETKKSYEDKLRLLIQNSKSYYPMASKDKAGSRTDPEVMQARTHQEFEAIQADGRTTGNTESDWDLAADTLIRRRELVVPTLKKEKIHVQQPANEPALPPADPPSPENDDPESYDITVVNRSRDIRYRARDLAEKMLRYKMREGSNWSPMTWLRRIKYHTAEEYFRQSWTQRIEKSMLENNNSALEWDLAKVALKDADANRAEELAEGASAVERVKVGELIAGEKKNQLDGPIKDRFVMEIIRPMISGGGAKDNAWVQEQLRKFVSDNKDDAVVSSIFGKDESGKIADYFASDIVELGRKIKGDLDSHKISLDNMSDLIKINIANTRWAAETDFEKTNADKAVAWTQDKLRGWLNPGTVGALFSTGTFIALRAPSSALRAMDLAAPGVGAIAGGLLAGVRRNYEVKLDRRTHLREMAYGKDAPDKDVPRREAMEKYRYDSASIHELRDGDGREAVLEIDKRRSVAELTGLTGEDRKKDENRTAIISRAAEIRSRLDLSALRHVDLVTFEGALKTEHGRLELLKTVCELKKSLLDAGVSEADYARELGEYEAKWADKLIGSIDEKDKDFKRYKLKQSFYSSLQGATYGFAAGLAVQELTALASRGLGIEAGSGPTILEKASDKFFGTDFAPKPTGAEYLVENLVKNGRVDLAQVTLRVDNGRVIIDQVGGRPFTGIAPEISFDSTTKTLVINGDITDPRFGDLDDAFRNSGLGIYVENSALPTSKTINTKDFMAQTKGSVDHFEWYGNNTMPSDMRELEMHNWKTDNGTGVTFSMAQMGKEAFQSGNTPHSVDVPQFVKEGKGVFTFWNPGDINNPVIIKADAQGLLTLDKSASAGEMVEVFKNGRWESVPERSVAHMLLGNLDNFQRDSDYTRHFEILNSKCSAGGLFEKDGKTHFGSFATIKGTGSMPDTIPGLGPDVKTVLTPPDPMKTAPPIAIPFAPRKPLEEMSKRDQDGAREGNTGAARDGERGISNNGGETGGGGQGVSGRGGRDAATSDIVTDMRGGSPVFESGGDRNDSAVIDGQIANTVGEATKGDETGADNRGLKAIGEDSVLPIVGNADAGLNADSGNKNSVTSTIEEVEAKIDGEEVGAEKDSTPVNVQEEQPKAQVSFVDSLFKAGTGRVGDAFIRVDTGSIHVADNSGQNRFGDFDIIIDRDKRTIKRPNVEGIASHRASDVLSVFENAGYTVN